MHYRIQRCLKKKTPNLFLILEIFREHGGARLAHNIIPYRLCRIAALTVVLHLVLCTGGEDDTGTLLGLIHTAKLEELEMKSVILKVIRNGKVNLLIFSCDHLGFSLHSSRESSDSYCVSKSRRFCLHCLLININGRVLSHTTKASVDHRYISFPLLRCSKNILLP